MREKLLNIQQTITTIVDAPLPKLPFYCVLGSLALVGLIGMAFFSTTPSQVVNPKRRSLIVKTVNHRPVFSRSLGELVANLSSRSRYIQTIVRLDIDQRSLQEMTRREARFSKRYTSYSTGALGSHWSAGYSKRQADRLASDILVDRFMPRLKDTALRVLAAQSSADLQEPNWMRRLRSELQADLNQAMKLPKPVIVNVSISSLRVVGLERLRPNASLEDSL